MAPSREIQDALRRLAERGRAAWPGVALSDDALAEHLTLALGDGCSETAVNELHADLFLAAAARAGDKAALTALDSLVRTSAARAAIATVSADDLAQHVRAELLVPGEERAAKILQYGGRGPLGAWLRVLATRAALTLQRGESRRTAKHTTEDALADVALAGSGPELQMLRASYAAPFRDAFREALHSIEAEDRNILRMHLVDDLSIDRLATVFKIHRATAARRVTKARETVLAKTQELLEARLGISNSEFVSLCGLMMSRIEVGESFLLPEEIRRSRS